MPLTALVSRRILCMHGGVSEELVELNQLRRIQRPLPEIEDQGLITDVLWSDPQAGIRGKKLLAASLPANIARFSGYVASPRGISFRFGEDVVIEMCNRLDLDLIVRAHQVRHHPWSASL